MYCKNCGAQVDESDEFCSRCGKALKEQRAFCPYCGAKTEENPDTCPNCGRLINNPSDKGGANGQQNATPSAVPDQNVQKKSKIAAGVLGILIGSLGVHNFYLGYTGKAVAQLLITLCTCGWGGMISGIWGLVEGIMILCDHIKVDGKGVPLE